MLELLEQSDLSDSRGRDAFILRLEANLLKRVDLIRVRVTRLIDNTVSPLANHLNLLILVNLRLHFDSFLLSFFLLILLR